MEKADWKVEGMTCTTCALNVTKYLEKNGLEQVKVNPLSGAVSFQIPQQFDEQKIKKGIDKLGYRVVDKAAHDNVHPDHHGHSHGSEGGGFLSNNKKRFFFTLPFTALLMLHMVHQWLPGNIGHWLMNPWVQLALCLPVFLVGMRYFGASAWQSLKNGVPNMDVLITLGAIASFGYSLAGMIMKLGPDYLFFETAATIITLVFLGNYLEEASCLLYTSPSPRD